MYKRTFNISFFFVCDAPAILPCCLLCGLTAPVGIMPPPPPINTPIQNRSNP